MQIANFPLEQTRVILTALGFLTIIPIHHAAGRNHLELPPLHSPARHAHHHIHHTRIAHK